MTVFDTHFDEMACLLYLDAQLEPAQADELRQHAAGCAKCGALLHALEGEAQTLRSALIEVDEPVPAHLFPRKAQPNSWPWIAVLGFAAAGAYTLWSTVFEPIQAQFVQAGFNQDNVMTMLMFSGAFWKGWDTMRGIAESLALVTLGILCVTLLRRRVRRGGAFAAVAGAIVLALLGAPGASAAEVRHGDPNYELPAGEVIHNDLIVAGDYVTIDGDVDGDLIAFTQDLIVNGHVKGDVLGWAKEIRIVGAVDGNVRGGSETFQLEGSVGKNITAWCGHFLLSPKSVVLGSVTLGAGDVELTGAVAKDIISYSSFARLNGIAGGNTMARAGKVVIGAEEQAKGTMKVEAHNPPSVDPGAKLSSPLQYTEVKHGEDYNSPPYYWHQVLKWGASFLFGLTMLLLMPGFFADAMRATERYSTAGGVGFLVLVATPVLAVIMAITIVGLGVSISLVFLYIISIYAAQVFVGAWVGSKLLGSASSTGAVAGRLALGLALLRIGKQLPYAGPLVAAIALVWGLGAIGLSMYRRTRSSLAVA
jgi:hypothetical protein